MRISYWSWQTKMKKLICKVLKFLCWLGIHYVCLQRWERHDHFYSMREKTCYCKRKVKR